MPSRRNYSFTLQQKIEAVKCLQTEPVRAVARSIGVQLSQLHAWWRSHAGGQFEGMSSECSFEMPVNELEVFIKTFYSSFGIWSSNTTRAIPPFRYERFRTYAELEREYRLTT